jgi:hypothetical protein
MQPEHEDCAGRAEICFKEASRSIEAAFDINNFISNLEFH